MIVLDEYLFSNWRYSMKESNDWISDTGIYTLYVTDVFGDFYPEKKTAIKLLNFTAIFGILLLSGKLRYLFYR